MRSSTCSAARATRASKSDASAVCPPPIPGSTHNASCRFSAKSIPFLSYRAGGRPVRCSSETLGWYLESAPRRSWAKPPSGTQFVGRFGAEATLFRLAGNSGQPVRSYGTHRSNHPHSATIRKGPGISALARPAIPALDCAGTGASLPGASGLGIDTYDGNAYVGLVPFAMLDVRPAWLPERMGFDFLETNVRTYVHAGGRDPGVCISFPWRPHRGWPCTLRGSAGGCRIITRACEWTKPMIASRTRAGGAREPSRG
jgi:hypothetical protein